jgi:hypothetical protein
MPRLFNALRTHSNGTNKVIDKQGMTVLFFAVYIESDPRPLATASLFTLFTPIFEGPEEGRLERFLSDPTAIAASPGFSHHFSGVPKPFRMNTCESISKQTTLTVFRMNTCEKQGGGGCYC